MKPKLWTYRAVCTAVYDGDTITANINLGFGLSMRKQKLRLFGINTPEMRGDAEEKIAGINARDVLRTWILDKEVIVETLKDRKGKYGRWLATVWLLDAAGEYVNINQLLVDHGLAEEYIV